MKVVIRAMLVSPVVLFLACAGHEIEVDMDSKTTIASATGGAVGAGIGAIVGNQVGNTGEGLVIGAVAGAGSGALIGRALDGQSERLKSQEEVLQQQERQLAAQRGEMDELRRLGQDNISFKDQLDNSLSNSSRNSVSQGPRASYNWPTRPANRITGRSNYRSNYEASGSTSSNATRSAQAVVISRPNVVEKSIVAEELQPRQQHAAFLERGTRDVQNQVGSLAANRSGDNDWIQPEVREEMPEAIEAPVPAAMPEQQQILGAIVDQPEAGSMPVSAIRLNTPECKQAASEASSARAAADAADKLFHYRRALRLCPDSADYHNDLGQVYLGLNRKEDARYEFQEALRLNPQHSRAQSSLGNL